MAEWLCSGLQSRVRRFDSGSSLQVIFGGRQVNRFRALAWSKAFMFRLKTREPIPATLISVSPGGVVVDSSSKSYIRLKTREPIPATFISVSPGGEIGRRNGLKIRRGQPLAGSSPAPGTIHFHMFGINEK
jgi:hypothetical protein